MYSTAQPIPMSIYKQYRSFVTKTKYKLKIFYTVDLNRNKFTKLNLTLNKTKTTAYFKTRGK